MAVHWRIPFKSLRGGVDYAVNIYDSSYSGSPVVLKGAATPFETEEDDDTDIFTPVRTQSGYVRVVDDGTFDWKQIIPTMATSRKVTLTDSNGERWCGYLQPQSFSGKLYGGVQEREFPVCCPLSVLDTVDFNPTREGITNFAMLLWYVLDTFDDITDVYFQGGTVVDDWLQKKANWLNFAQENDDNEMEAKYSCQSVLADICRFFGWSCRISGRDVYMTRPDESSDFIVYNMQDLYHAGQGYTEQYTSSPISARNIDGIFASMNNDEVIVAGIRKATIEADINETPELMEVPYGSIAEIYEDNTVVRTTYGTLETKYLFTKKAAESPSADFTLTFANMLMTFAQGGSYTSGGITYYYFASPHIYEYYEESIALKHSYDFTNTLAICGMATNDTPLVNLISRTTFSLSEGMIVISGNTFINTLDPAEDSAHKTYAGNGYLTAVLKVGDKYWNGSTWVSSWASFSINTGAEDLDASAFGSGKIINNRELTSSYPNYDGHGVPVSSAVGGIVEFGILGFHDNNYPEYPGYRSLEIQNLKIEFVRPTTPRQDDHNKYTAEGSVNFSEERTEDLILASDNNNQFGSGIVMNSDGSYCQTLTYSSGASQHPEQNTVDRMAAFGAVSRRCLNLEVLAYVNSSPTEASGIKPDCTVSVDDVTGYPVSVGRDWRDDIIKVTLIEL